MPLAVAALAQLGGLSPTAFATFREAIKRYDGIPPSRLPASMARAGAGG